MDNNPKGPYKYYERPEHGRSESDYPHSGGKWGLVISILIIILVILIPTVHGLANKNIHHAEQAKEVERVSSHRITKRAQPKKKNHQAKIRKNKEKQSSSQKPSSSTSSKTVSTYVVQDGDTLSSIAEKNGLSVSELASLNNLDDSSSIDAGQTLKLK